MSPFSGDFRQILPVVPRGSRGMIVLMCFRSSSFYQCVNFLSLIGNMRRQEIENSPEEDNAVLEYPQFMLKDGEGKLERTTDSLIDLPLAINIVDSATDLVESVFKLLNNNYDDVRWLNSWAILTPTNSRLKNLNEQVAEAFPGTFSCYKSADSVLCDSSEAQNAAELRYPQELLNSIELWDFIARSRNGIE